MIHSDLEMCKPTTCHDGEDQIRQVNRGATSEKGHRLTLSAFHADRRLQTLTFCPKRSHICKCRYSAGDQNIEIEELLWQVFHPFFEYRLHWGKGIIYHKIFSILYEFQRFKLNIFVFWLRINFQPLLVTLTICSPELVWKNIGTQINLFQHIVILCVYHKSHTHFSILYSLFIQIFLDCNYYYYLCH